MAATNRIGYLHSREVPRLMELADGMHSEGVYADYPLNRERTFHNLRRAINHPHSCCLGAYSDEQLVGALIGEVTTDAWCDVAVAVDHVFYVDPEYRRGTLGVRLLKTFEAWAADNGADVIRPIVYAGINNGKVGKLLQAMRYEDAGGIYYKECSQ